MSPKSRFLLSNDNITKHRDMVDSGTFQRGLDFALMQYAQFLATQASDGNTAMAVGFKLQGAQEFVVQFKTLSETVQIQTPAVNDNLDHRS